MGTLYLVATPIGNLEDMSPRALRILRQVSLIAAEDTRVTQKLLSHFAFTTPLTSYFEHNKLAKMQMILAALKKGEVALVSDAGTPGINDPGYELIKAALDAGHEVCPIPGPSAPLAALAASGLATDSFLYLGYLPRRSAARLTLLRQVSDLPYTLIFLESPHRLLASLADMQTALGDRAIAVARELTKVHEQIWRGQLGAAESYFNGTEPRGEFTLVVEGKAGRPAQWSEDKVQIALKFGIKLDVSPAALAKRLSEESGWDRKELYSLITAMKKTDDSG